LDRIMSKPLAASSDLRNSPANIDKPMILAPGTMPRRADAVSTPYSIGMLRSKMTKAGARSLAFSMAAGPLPASQQALKGVALSMKSQMAPRTAALSSTTRIHGVRGGRMVGNAESTRLFMPRPDIFSVPKAGSLRMGGHAQLRKPSRTRD